MSGPEGMHACQAIDADNGDYFRPPYNLRRDKQHVVFFMKLLYVLLGMYYVQYVRVTSLEQLSLAEVSGETKGL